MNVDAILQALRAERVDYILIGGMNFLLNHAPILTYDVDLWIADTEENRVRLNRALRELQAAWGATENEWGAVPEDPAWLMQQGVFCLTSPHGAIDVFREVKGLEGRYAECRARAAEQHSGTGTPYFSLSDEDMLRCQEALPQALRNPARIEVLKKAIARRNTRGRG